MSQLRKGVLGLSLFNADTKKWGQAHTQGAYVLTQYLYQNQKSEMIKFEVKESEEDFLIHLDKDLLWTEGRQMIREFLIILQTYKSTGYVERGLEFYSHYSKVEGDMLKIRDYVIKKKKARRVELNNTLVRYNEEIIEPIVYPECFESIILSYQDKYPFTHDFYEQMHSEWRRYRDHLRVKL